MSRAIFSLITGIVYSPEQSILVKYIANRDEYLYYDITSQAEREFDTILHQDGSAGRMKLGRLTSSNKAFLGINLSSFRTGSSLRAQGRPITGSNVWPG